MNPLEYTPDQVKDLLSKRLAIFPPLGELTIEEYVESLPPLFGQFLFAYNMIPAPLDPIGTIPLMLLYKLTGETSLENERLLQMYEAMDAALKRRYANGDFDAEDPQYQAKS